MKSPIIAIDTKHLMKLIDSEIQLHGNTCNLNHIDTTHITQMNGIFIKSDFNGDISHWNVSNVTNMYSMFGKSKFKGDISNWDVGNVTDMAGMFYGSEFNGDISNWNVGKVTNMSDMFYFSQFKGDIGNWNIENLIYVNNLFDYSHINKPWWFIEDSKSRKIAIENYHLMNRLNNKLQPKKNRELNKI